MSKRMQTYYSAVLGALGGLLGWWGVGSVALSHWSVWLAYPLIGAGLGLSIAGCVAAGDGALVKRRPGRALRDGFAGALAGALAGLLGLLLAEMVFLAVSGGFAGRTVGWMLLGGSIGLADLAVHRQPRRALYGAIGGLAGGALGGLIYEGLTQLFLSQSGPVQIVVGGVGLTLLGACIGLLIPLARQALAAGTLRVLDGDQAGLAIEVVDSATVGRYDGCEVYLPDRSVAWRHLRVRRTAGGFAADVLPEAEHPALIGGHEVLPGQTAALRGGEQIRLGATTLEFAGRS